MADFRFGNIRDTFDPRDFPLFTTTEFRSSLIAKQSTAAGKTFILPDLPPVYNQGRIGSCGINAVAAALRYAHKKATGKTYADFEPSRMFMYYNSRVNNEPETMNTSTPQDARTLARFDSGSKNRTTIHSLLVQGVCEENLWPYGDPVSAKPPNEQEVFQNLEKKPNPVEPLDMDKATWQARGSSHLKDGKALLGERDMIPRSINYYRIFDPSAIQNLGNATRQSPPSAWELIFNTVPISLFEKTLLDGFPFIFGVRVYQDADLRQAQHMSGGVLVKPPMKNSADLAGHTMLAVGFDSVKRLFLVQNSWGSDWANGLQQQDQKGRFWMPYEWFESEVNGSRCTYDYWVIKTSLPTNK